MMKLCNTGFLHEDIACIRKPRCPTSRLAESLGMSSLCLFFATPSYIANFRIAFTFLPTSPCFSAVT
jgi:hypothetical protein